MSDAAQFAQELRATYTDWPMDDPAVRLARCDRCGCERLVREHVWFTPFSLYMGFYEPTARVPVVKVWWCRPCSRSMQE